MSKTTNKMIATTRLSLVSSLSLVSMTILSGMLLSSSVVSAEDIVDEINITVPVSCSLSGTGMTSHTATIENGRYVSDIGTTTLKAFCNDNNGFAIYATGYTGNVIGQENSNKLVGTPSTIGNISTGTATSGDTSNWSMKLATTSTPTPTYPITIDNSFNAYKEVPNEYTKVAHRDSSTDIGEDAEGATLTTTYASYISKTQAAGAYSGKVIYTLVHPSNEEPPHEVACEAGKICYNPNTTTALGEMGKQTPTSTELTDGITLWAPNFKRTGYGFAGWNTAYDYSGTNYGPNQTITAPADVETNGLSLYAMWIPSQGTQQNWGGCSSMNIGDVTALTDNRDNDTYAVAKLADGKCWMTENLRLDNDALHNSDGYLAQGYSSSFVGLAEPETANFDKSTVANSLYSVDGSTAITISSNAVQDPWYRFPRYNNNNTSLEQSSASYSTTDNTYIYGNYYTWTAAVADTNYHYTGTYNTTSICPAGWHLPTGGTATAEFGALDVAMGGTGANQTDNTGKTQSAKWRTYPNNFVYSGRAWGSSVVNRGAYGIYWTSTLGYTASYQFVLGGALIRPGTETEFGYRGNSVRCIAEP